MRIGLVVPGFSTGPGDWCIPVVSTLVRMLAERHDVEVVALRHPSRRPPYDFFGARVHALGFGMRSGPARIVLVRRAVRLLRRRHGDRPFDVLHGLWCHEPALVAGWAGRQCGVPSAASLFGGELTGIDAIGYGDQLHLGSRLLVRRGLRAASLVVAHSRAMATLAAQAVADDRLRMLPLPVDTARFAPNPSMQLPALNGRPRLLHVGSLIPVKNQTLLLEAIARLRTELPEACLHIIGDGPLRETLRRRAAELHLDGDAVRFHGEIPHAAMPVYYAAADLLWMASWHESYCMAVVEAAACGCPCLGSAVGILPELSGAGVSLERPTAATLAEATIALLRAPERLAEMADEARNFARTHLAPATVCAAWEGLYAAAAHITAP